MNKYILSFAAILICGCTDVSKSARILDSQGYTSVEFTGYKIFGCSKDDMFHTGFKAISPGGRPCSGVVCSDIFKAATIRLD